MAKRAFVKKQIGTAGSLGALGDVVRILPDWRPNGTNGSFRISGVSASDTLLIAIQFLMSGPSGDLTTLFATRGIAATWGVIGRNGVRDLVWLLNPGQTLARIIAQLTEFNSANRW